MIVEFFFGLVLAWALGMAFGMFKFATIFIQLFLYVAVPPLLLLFSLRIVKSFLDQDFVGKEAWSRISPQKVWPQRPPRKPPDNSNDPLASNIAPVDC